MGPDMIASGAKGVLRDAAAMFGASCGLTAASRRHRSRLVIITLHRVLPASLRARYPYPGLCVTPDELDWLLVELRRDYSIGTLAEQHGRHLREVRGRKPLLAITFDDGQLDNYEYARPVLERHGVRGTFFVPAGAIDSGAPLWHDRLGFAAMLARDPERGAGLRSLLAERGVLFDVGDAPQRLADWAKGLGPSRRASLLEVLVSEAGAGVPPWARMMRWDEVRSLAAEGHEIGSHSMSHPLLSQCSDDELDFELAESRASIEAETGERCESFCYPGGDFDERAIAGLAAAGYARAATTKWGTNTKGAHRFFLDRCDMDVFRLRDSAARLSGPLLRLRLSGLHPAL